MRRGWSVVDIVERLRGAHITRWHETMQEAADEIERLREALGKIQRNAWCYIPGDDHVYDCPLEWAEYDLDAKLSPHIEQFGWAGHLPNTWAVFHWSGDDDDGEWNVVEYESEQAARAALKGDE